MGMQPGYTVINVSIVAGATQRIGGSGASSGFGVARRVFFSPTLMTGNSLRIIFGANGQPIDFVGYSGVQVGFGEDFDELSIQNIGVGTATGQMVFGPCDDFLFLGL